MNVVLFGLGSIGKQHVNALNEISTDIEIYAVRSTKNQEKYLNVNNISSLDEIRNIPISFILIANPTSEHVKTIYSLLPKEIPLFIEKPISNSLSEINNLIKIIEDNQIKNYVACNLRFHPSIKWLKQHLSAKTSPINEVNIYCGSDLRTWRPNNDYKKTYSALPELGGGVHLDLIHEIDYAYHLFGTPSNVISNLHSKSSLNIPSIDQAHYILEYPKFNVNILLNYFRPRVKRSIEIVFEDNIWFTDLISSKITDIDNLIIFQEPDYNIKSTHIEQLLFFIRHIENDGPIFNTIREAHEILKICLNSYHVNS